MAISDYNGKIPPVSEKLDFWELGGAGFRALTEIVMLPKMSMMRRVAATAGAFP